MKLSNAIKKLENAGYVVKGDLGSFYATLNNVTLTFFSQNDICSKFTFNSESSCAPTFGLSLKQAMDI